MTVDCGAVPTADDVLGAAQRLAGVAHRTPVMVSHTLDERLGAKVYFKCENLQRMGAFKFRGALLFDGIFDARAGGVGAPGRGLRLRRLRPCSPPLPTRSRA